MKKYVKSTKQTSFENGYRKAKLAYRKYKKSMDYLKDK